jgi:hypothetical protein
MRTVGFNMACNGRPCVAGRPKTQLENEWQKVGEAWTTSGRGACGRNADASGFKALPGDA